MDNEQRLAWVKKAYKNRDKRAIWDISVKWQIRPGSKVSLTQGKKTDDFFDEAFLNALRGPFRGP